MLGKKDVADPPTERWIKLIFEKLEEHDKLLIEIKDLLIQMSMQNSGSAHKVEKWINTLKEQ